MLKAGIVAALLIAQEPIGVPSPQPSPLKQIIDLKARPLCTTLGHNVQIALVGLMKNDDVIEAGRRTFIKMAWDQAQGSSALDMDLLNIKNEVSALVGNLYQIDQILDDPARFPLNPTTADERAADRMKAALQAVEAEQKAQLNVLDGTLETDELSGMRHNYAEYNPTVNNPRQSSVPTAAPATMTNAGVQAPKPAATVMPRVNDSSQNDYGVAGNTSNAGLARAIANGQTSVAFVEGDATTVIVSVADDCRRPTPAGSPLP
jgi:hypothetical protein